MVRWIDELIVEISVIYYLLSVIYYLLADGEASGIRTRDPVIKSHMLYQLSYRPKNVLKIVYEFSNENKNK